MPNKRRNLAIFTVLLPLLNLQKIAGKTVYHIYNKLYSKWLILNSRVAARRGAARWVEIFGNVYKIACMVDLSVFLFINIFFQKPGGRLAVFHTQSHDSCVHFLLLNCSSKQNRNSLSWDSFPKLNSGNNMIIINDQSHSERVNE